MLIQKQSNNRRNDIRKPRLRNLIWAQRLTPIAQRSLIGHLGWQTLFWCCDQRGIYHVTLYNSPCHTVSKVFNSSFHKPLKKASCRVSFTGVQPTQLHSMSSLEEPYTWFNALLLPWNLPFSFFLTRVPTFSFSTKHIASPVIFHTASSFISPQISCCRMFPL